MVGRTPWSARDARVPLPNNDIGILQGASRPTGASAADQGVRPTNTGQAGRTVLLHLHQHEREVVVLGGVLDPVLQLLGDAGGHLFYGKRAYHAQKILQPVLAELFVARIQRLGDAVAEDDRSEEHRVGKE